MNPQGIVFGSKSDTTKQTSRGATKGTERKKRVGDATKKPRAVDGAANSSKGDATKKPGAVDGAADSSEADATKKVPTKGTEKKTRGGAKGPDRKNRVPPATGGPAGHDGDATKKPGAVDGAAISSDGDSTPRGGAAPDQLKYGQNTPTAGGHSVHDHDLSKKVHTTNETISREDNLEDALSSDSDEESPTPSDLEFLSGESGDEWVVDSELHNAPSERFIGSSGSTIGLKRFHAMVASIERRAIALDSKRKEKLSSKKSNPQNAQVGPAK